MTGKTWILLGAGVALAWWLTRKAQAASAPGSSAGGPSPKLFDFSRPVTVPTYTFAPTGPSATTGHDVIPIGRASDATLQAMDRDITRAQKDLYDLADPAVGGRMGRAQVRTTQTMLRAHLVDLVQRRRQFADTLTSGA